MSSALTDLIYPSLEEGGEVARLISPAGYAFSIWGLIFSLLGLFVVYQALPDAWIDNRNNDLIFNYMSYAWLINMATQVVWAPFFRSETGWGYVISAIAILLMLASSLAMMVISTRMEVNGWEWTFIRGGFSVYSGWLTAATILNITAILSYFGFEGFNWFSEEAITITILYVAGLIYNLASFIEFNPLYGAVLAVFIWVVVAIRYDVITERPQNEDLQVNLEYLGIF